MFASDTACDVRESYRALLDSGVDDDRSTLEVLEAYGTDDPEVWLALAASRSEPFWNVLEESGEVDTWGGSEFCRVFPDALAFIRGQSNS